MFDREGPDEEIPPDPHVVAGQDALDLERPGPAFDVGPDSH